MADKPDDIQYIYRQLRRLGTINDKIVQLIILYEESQATIHTLREAIQELSSDIDNIYDVALVILDRLEHMAPTDAKAKRLTAELRREMLDRRRRSVQRQLVIQTENRNRLEEQAAECGNRPPLELTNQIIRTNEAIEKLQTELEIFKADD